MIDIRRLAFIGGGNMAAALIGGLIRQGLPSGRIVVADPSAAQLDRLVRTYGVLPAADNGSAAAGAEALILAVKPQQMRPVCLALKPHVEDAKPLVISVAAGIPHAALSRWFGAAHRHRAHHAESAGPERLRRHRPVCPTERRRGR